MDTVSYRWSVAGGGSLTNADGPGTIYQPPDMPVGNPVSISINVMITDSRGNDKPAEVQFTILMWRTDECRYDRQVSFQKKTDTVVPPEVTPTGNKCQPKDKRWDKPSELKGSAGGLLKLCVGQRVILRASGPMKTHSSWSASPETAEEPKSSARLLTR